MLRFSLFFWCVTCGYFLVVESFEPHGLYEDIDLSTVQLIRKNGYPVEIYSNVSTEDNYLLDIYRIPHGRFRRKKRLRRPVLLMHGLLGTSRDFVIMGPERGLAYLLADKGYDVWLPNARGTIYSRKHLKLNPDLDPDFWAFSWHEIGFYDLPAAFELIRNVTKQERLSYVGMSQGTTVFYVLTSMRPEYNRNVSVMISLAPVAYVTHFYSPILKALAAFEPIWTPLSRAIGINEVVPPPLRRLLQIVNKLFCTQKGFFQDLCAQLLFVTGGYDPAQLNITILPVGFGLGPSAAMRQISHYAQNINSGLFRLFNFGPRINLRKYRTPQPPSYNLTKITSPVALFYSEGDWLVHPLDVERLSMELVNCVDKYIVPYKQFNHYDFLVANDVIKLVFKRLFNILKRYNNSYNT